MKYTIEKRVSPCDLDVFSRPFPSFYFRCMQEAAHMHMTSYPPSPEELRDVYKRGFVLSRAALSIHGDLNACEKINVTTWASDAHGASFPRSIEITDSNGQTVAKISSVWALVNTETHTICRPDDYPCSYTTEPQTETELPLRFRIPRDVSFELVGEYIPHYSDLDLNRHVNNTRYPDILLGYLPETELQRISGVGISYLHEARVNDTLKIYISKHGNGFYFRSVLPDGETNVEMTVNFAK